MLETAINNSTEKLGLQHEILEVGGVDTDIVTPESSDDRNIDGFEIEK